jgi:DNA segregation ATPase FtsK/SpoIIIE, S-DNA-T family
MSGFGSTQRLPGIGQEKPAPVELADRWHSFARRVRWWAGTASHLRAIIPVVVVAGIVGRTFGKLGLTLTVIEVVGLVVLIKPAQRVVVNETRHALGLWWRYRWSSNASRVGLGADGESSVFEAPELRQLRIDPLGRTYRLRVSRLKLAEIEASAERLRGKWKAHHVLVTVPRPGFVDLRVLKRDPLAIVTHYQPGRPVATLQDGQRFDWQVGGGHALIAGSTGSGKSGILSAIVASFAHRPDVALLAVDLKRVEVAALLPRCSAVATDLTESHRLLAWTVEEMERRWQTMAVQGIRTWTGLQLVLIVDEFAAVAAVDPLHPDQKQAASEAIQRLGLVDALTARGRAAGIELLICTQSPAAEMFGKTAIRANLPRRLIARVVSADQAYVGAGVRGTNAEQIRADRPGTCSLIVPGFDGVQTARFAYLSDDAVEAMAIRYAHLAPVIDIASSSNTTTPTEPGPEAPTNPPANPRHEDSHNRRAGATDPYHVPTADMRRLIDWSTPLDFPANEFDPLAPIPVTDADIMECANLPADRQAFCFALLADTSGDSPGGIYARLATLVNPKKAETDRPTLLPPSGSSRLAPCETTPGPHPTPQTASDTTKSAALIVPFDHPARTNPKTGRPYPASYRRRWPDGTLRNYPQPPA